LTCIKRHAGAWWHPAHMSLPDTHRPRHVEAALQRRLEELLAELGQSQDDALALSRSAGRAGADDPKEHAQAQERSAVRDAEATRDHDELVAVRAALARLADGSYGECTGCGKRIAPARLEAQPAAARCIQCQTAAEARGAA